MGRPVGIGWNSVVDQLNFSYIDLTLRDTAGRYEGGTQNTPGLIGLGASLGLLSMEERATLVAGGFELESAPGRGTEVHAWFPLKWRIPNS